MDASQKLQLVGLAFAGADLVFEVTEAGEVTFALGATEHLTGRKPSDFVGSNWRDVVGPDDADLLTTLLENLKPGERQGPLRVALSSSPVGRLPRFASLCVFRLPQAGSRISCALSLGAPAVMDRAPRDRDGLLPKETFPAAAATLLAEAERAGLPVRLDLVELDGLDAAVSAMDSSAAEATRRRVAATLRAESYAGAGASEVATDRFALVRPADGAAGDRLAARLRNVAGAGVTPVTAELALAAETPSQNLRAMRYALDRYIEDGADAAKTSFKSTIERTMRDTGRFKAMLAAGSFHLAYQPVVDLKTRALHHFEALARFDPNSSPADTIRLAEELGLILDFDLAVARCVAAILASTPDLKVAVNLSAVSLMTPGFVAMLAQTTALDPDLRPRLLLEVTETQALADLPLANEVIGQLRRLGHVVCLDDFGAGGASLDYLRHLEVDIIKIDGRYIQALDTRPRDIIILRHVVALCRELGVATIAEMVEGPEAARLAGELGVELAQGWHFSKPLPEPRWEPAAAPPARRAGEVEQWG